jgi:hypothetical protein
MRRSTRRRHQKRRTQKGGSQKHRKRYIAHVGRELWTDTLYPLSGAILAAFRQINWPAYQFAGVSENSDWDPKADEPIITPMQMTATAGEIPYAVLGGAACELYGRANPRGPPFWRYVEPTADMDVLVAYPRITQIQRGEYLAMIYNGDHFTALGDHYTRWLFAELIRVMTPLAILMDHIGLPLVRMNMEDDGETAAADIHVNVGNLLIARVPLPERNMIKLQVGASVSRGGNRVCSHILELIFTIVSADPHAVDNTDGRIQAHRVTQLDGIYVDEIFKLLNAQFNALKDRLDTPTKVYNHYARVRYLLALIADLHRKGVISIFQGQGRLKFHLKQVLDGAAVFDDPTACPPPAICDRAEVLAPIMALL